MLMAFFSPVYRTILQRDNHSFIVTYIGTIMFIYANTDHGYSVTDKRQRGEIERDTGNAPWNHSHILCNDVLCCFLYNFSIALE